MGRVVPLSDSKIKNLKVRDKDYKVSGGDGQDTHAEGYRVIKS